MSRVFAFRAALVGVLALVLLLPATLALAHNGVSGRGVVPSLHAGNFVAADDDQVCYELSRQGLIGEVTAEMVGVKIDPAADFSDTHVSVTLSEDGRSLDWTIADATMVAVIVKGGPNFHLYDYQGTGFTWDSGLHSPLHKRNVPQISHYNLCYIPHPAGGEGCTPGYWRNHTDRWSGVAPGDDFDATFGVDLFAADVTLAQAVQLQGGGVNALARHATAALLNAHGGVPNADGTTVAYPLSAAEVIALVQEAVAAGTVEDAKDTLAAMNEAGCPLAGSAAQPV